jgi:hypothetical protein
MKKLILLLAVLAPAYAADVKLRWDPVLRQGVWQYELLAQPVDSTNAAQVVAISVGETNVTATATLAQPAPTRFWVVARNAVGVSERSNMVLWPDAAPSAPGGLSIDVSVAVSIQINKAALQSMASETNWVVRPYPVGLDPVRWENGKPVPQ